jgi:HD-GYP domain-containing protein (c-di-GMP phosphodiesterase class II)
MSSDRPSDDPSSGPEAELAARVKAGGPELLESVERHLPGSRDHSDGSAAYAFAAAVELELARDHAEAVREAARLHEVGSVYVPAELGAKPAAELTAEERELLDSRFARGAELARGAGVPDRACEWIEASGERFDGGGPSGLAGERIPVESRIVRVACVCDAALAAPAPADGPPDARWRGAVDVLNNAAGSELDPRVTAALVAMLERAAAAP